MSQRKYDTRIRKEKDGFVAEVIRRRTAKGTVVDRSQRGFPERKDAQQWVSAALDEYRARRKVRAAANSARKKRERAKKRTVEKWLQSRTLQQLAEAFQNGEPYSNVARTELTRRAESLWTEVTYRVSRSGAQESVAHKIATEKVGRKWAEQLQRALAGDLDQVAKEMDVLAAVSARAILARGREQPDPSDTQWPCELRPTRH